MFAYSITFCRIVEVIKTTTAERLPFSEDNASDIVSIIQANPYCTKFSVIKDGERIRFLPAHDLIDLKTAKDIVEIFNVTKKS